MSGKVTKSIQERFEAKWTPEPNSGCWLWISGGNKFQYGKLYFNGRNEMATRVSWFLKYGQLPSPELQVCHKCDTPACVNPDHLFLGTMSDNQMDCVLKGRRTYTRGYGKDWNVTRTRKEVKKLVCKHGHPLSGDNLYICPKGWAQCKECRRQSVYSLKRKRVSRLIFQGC
jgi:hypothetical protein